MNFSDTFPGFFPDNGIPWRAWDAHVLSITIPGFILCIFFLVLGIRFRNNKKAANITVFCLGLLLLSTELYKQICRNMMRGMQFGEYAFEIFPWQICSIPMFISLLMPLFRRRGRDTLFMFMGVYSMMGGFFALFANQQGLFGWGDVGIYVQTILWHVVLLWLGFFSLGYLSIGKYGYKRNMRVCLYSYGLLVVFSGIAQFINWLIPNVYGINSAQAMNTNMWYISMYYPSPVFVLKDIWASGPNGWIWAYLLYMVVLGLGNMIFINIYYFVYHGYSKFRFRRKLRTHSMLINDAKY